MGTEDHNLFLNYWNLQQTFLVRGYASRENFQSLMAVLRKRCPSATIKEMTALEKPSILVPQRQDVH